MKKTFLIPVLFLSVFFATDSYLVFAQGVGTPGSGGAGNQAEPITLENPFRGGNSLFELLRSVINNILLPIGGVLAVLAFIYSGFLYVTAQGNETKIGKAHQALLYTAVGTALLLGAWVFANAICGTIEAISGNQNICPEESFSF